MNHHEVLRERHLHQWLAAAGDRIDRLRWSPDEIRQHQDRSLRALLQVAVTRSPWHRDRLAGVDTDTFSVGELRSLPTMTKQDLLASFDDIVTDDRLSLHLAERHLAGLGHDDAYLLDEFHAVASGGSSGTRAVFVYGWDPWIDVHLGLGRHAMAAAASDPVGTPLVMGVVTAGNVRHMTTAAATTFRSPFVETVNLPVSLPLVDVVAGLNAAQPTALTAYASMLGVLAEEARAGRLSIRPRRIVSTSEPLLPEVRAAAEEAFDAPVANCWGTSEGGVMAVGCWTSEGMHLNEDLVVVEAVDQHGNPVPPGETSARVLVTNLFNPTLPLVRYELDDEIVLLDEPCSCGSSYRRVADVQGRVDDVFRYGDRVLHPHVIRSVFTSRSEPLEYQAVQVDGGLRVRVLHGREIATDAVAGALREALAVAGFADLTVAVEVVDALDRHPETGKLRRFLPLGTRAAIQPA